MFGVAGQRASLLKSTKRDQYVIWGAIFVLAHAAGGAALGGLLGWAGGMLTAGAQRVLTVALAAGCVLWALIEFGAMRVPMPQLRRQVPRTWINVLPWNALAIGFGLQLGCGVATYITVQSFYAAAGCALLSGSAATGALMLGCFGIARSVAASILGPRLSSPGRSIGFVISFEAWEARVRKVNGLVLAAAACLLVL